MGQKSERGESRAIYTAIADDDDFLELSPEAKCLWYTLKMKLGASGIGVLYEGEIAEVTGIPFETLSDPIQELIEGRWLLRERNVWWLRNGLMYEPYVRIENENHRKGVEKHLRGLPKRRIVNEYAEYYGLDPIFPDLVEEAEDPTPSKPLRRGSASPPKQESGVRSQEEGDTASSSTARESDELPEQDPPDDSPFAELFPDSPAAVEALESLEHRGGRRATVATLRTSFVYEDQSQASPDPSVQGRDPPERRQLVTRALVQMADQGVRRWSGKALAGFIRGLEGTNGRRHAAGSGAKGRAKAGGGSGPDIRGERRRQHG